MRQIMQQRPEFSNKMRELYRVHSNQGKQPSITELMKIFEHWISELGGCFIVLDALDDVRNEPKRREVLSLVHLEGVNLMVTSRPLDNIKALFNFISECTVCQKRTEIFFRENAADMDSPDICEDCFYQGHSALPEKGHYTTQVYSALRLDIQASADDLRAYVQWRIRGSGPLSNCVQRHGDLEQEIVDTVVERAEGM